MWRYVYEDMAHAVSLLGYGLAVGIPLAAIVVWLIDQRRKKRGDPPVRWMPPAAFCIYLAVILTITFLSRESGSRSDVFDLELFSTWGINDRNNALVAENIMLFIPFGFLLGWAGRWKRPVLPCTFFGAVVSLGIETMQLLTRRGFFQIDDIVTNTMGAVAGAILFGLIRFLADLKSRSGPGEGGGTAGKWRSDGGENKGDP